MSVAKPLERPDVRHVFGTCAALVCQGRQVANLSDHLCDRMSRETAVDGWQLTHARKPLWPAKSYATLGPLSKLAGILRV
jgi:hypothetical protein